MKVDGMIILLIPLGLAVLGCGIYRMINFLRIS